MLLLYAFTVLKKRVIPAIFLLLANIIVVFSGWLDTYLSLEAKILASLIMITVMLVGWYE